MTIRVSVLISVDDETADLRGLLASLDLQTFDYEEFEVLLVVGVPESRLTQQLRDLAQRRPNLAVHVSVGVADVAAQARGAFVLTLNAEQVADGIVLFDDGLRRAWDFATEHGCDAVLARTVLEGEPSTPTLLTADQPSVDNEPAVRCAHAGLILAARELVVRHAGSATALLKAAQAVGVAGAYPLAQIRPDSSKSVVDVASGLRCVAGWTDRELEITVARSNIDEKVSATWLRNVQTGLEFWVPVRSGDPIEDDQLVHVRLDHAIAAAAGPLPSGVWQVGLGLPTADEPEVLLRVALPAGAKARAVIDGVPIAVIGWHKALALDIGSWRVPPVRRIDPTEARIVESSAGARFTAELPGLAWHGEKQVEGALLLDGLPFPAHLSRGPRGPELTSYVSGLAGLKPVSTRFGTAKPTPAGIDLCISEVGTMTLRSTLREQRPSSASAPELNGAGAPSRGLKPGASETPPPSPAAKHPTRRGAKPRWVSRLRRAVPQPLEPVARRLARNPTARRAYRALARPARH